MPMSTSICMHTQEVLAVREWKCSLFMADDKEGAWLPMTACVIRTLGVAGPILKCNGKDKFKAERCLSWL